MKKIINPKDIIALFIAILCFNIPYFYAVSIYEEWIVLKYIFYVLNFIQTTVLYFIIGKAIDAWDD